MLLSICIPTLNRSGKLLNLLNELLIQCNGKQIEIIISDNASTDSTKNKCLILDESNPQIHYYANESNLGFSENIRRVVSLSTGRYVWIIGDDDIVSYDAIESIYEFLTNSNDLYDLVVLNMCRVSADQSFNDCKREFDINENLINISLDEMLQHTGSWLSFMSINIFSGCKVRDSLDSFPVKKSDYFVFWLTIYIGSGERCSFLSKTLIIRKKLDNNLSTHGFLNWRTYLVDFLQPLNWAVHNKHITPTTRNKLMTEMYKGFGLYVFIRFLLIGDSRDARIELLRKNYMIPQFWIYVAPILVLPRAAIKVLLISISRFLSFFNRKELAEKIDRLTIEDSL